MDNEKKTPFSAVYNMFFVQITDDLYVVLTEDEAKEDAQGMLIESILKFRYPKVNVKDFSLGVEIDGIKQDVFNVELSIDEILILSMLMTSEWIERQMKTVRLTEQNYTGSDAKVLNTKSQMSTLQELKASHTKSLERQLRYYHYSTVDDGNNVTTNKLNLAGKGVGNRELLSTISKARRT